MAHYNSIALNISSDPPLDLSKIRVIVNVNPNQLLQIGFNLPVEITTATMFRQPPNPEPFNSITVMAHFDTGASITSIDLRLAQHLKLIPTGQSVQHTANGSVKNPTFAIDLAFPNTGLRPFANLQIGSCQLPFDLSKPSVSPSNFTNFGLLLGRDIMSGWNIVWNGPTSTVLVSD